TDVGALGDQAGHDVSSDVPARSGDQDHGTPPRSYSAATFFGTTIRQASRTSSRISVRSIASSRTSTQWYRMSDGRGRKNFSGSAATNASRSSFGNPRPISVSSRENARKTIRPTRNFTRSRTSTSSVRGRVEARARTSSIVTIRGGSHVPPTRPRDRRTSTSSRRRRVQERDNRSPIGAEHLDR